MNATASDDCLVCRKHLDEDKVPDGTIYMFIIM